MRAIVAVDRNWGIGKDGSLLVNIPADKRFFRENTIGKAVVMGRRTFESLPGRKGLPDRLNIVFTRQDGYYAERAIVVHSIEEMDTLLGLIEPDKIMVIGGGEIYRMFLDRCTDVLVTKIDHEFDADTYFPDLDRNPNWYMDPSPESDPGIYETPYGPAHYRFCRYVNDALEM